MGTLMSWMPTALYSVETSLLLKSYGCGTFPTSIVIYIYIFIFIYFTYVFFRNNPIHTHKYN